MSPLLPGGGTSWGPDYAEWVTNLVQDLGAEASLCKLVLKGISNCAWKPRNLVRHCAKGQAPEQVSIWWNGALS